MSWYGCYALDLYCDNLKQLQDDTVHTYDEFPHQYTDEYGAACRSIAREHPLPEMQRKEAGRGCYRHQGDAAA